jgi:uncharacterized membrane protein HdeD (DUF308 family)
VSISQTPADASGSLDSRRLIHDHWGMFLAEGIILSILGVAAIFVPPIAGLATTVLLGWVFLLAGIVGLIATFGARKAPGFLWALLSAIVAIVAGGILLFDPLQGLITLTFVLIAYFIFDGVLMIALAISHRKELSGKWEWLLFNGIIDLLLAGIVIAGLPGTLLWALGLLVGIDMIFGGSALITMALDARKTAVP